MRAGLRITGLAGLAGTMLWLASEPAPARADTGAKPPMAVPAEVLRGIELNFTGLHEDALDAAAALRKKDAADPWAAMLETYTLFWLMLYDDEDTRYDKRIEESSERTVSLAEARLEAGGDEALANFFLGQGYMNRGRLEGWRGRYYQAGRDGERARKHLEKTIELRPDWTDARFQLGLYYFFASMIPDLVTKWLGWLWFIPTGNAAEGIAFLEEVAEDGVVFRQDARYMVANIATYHRPEHMQSGLEILREIRVRFPDNVILHNELIEALHENGLAHAVYSEAEALGAHPRRNERERAWAAAMSPIWKARASVLLDDPERALEILAPLVAAPPERPLFASAWVDLVLGQTFDVLGRREEALAQYQRVLAYEKPKGSQRAARLAKLSIATPFVPPRPTEIRAAP